MRNSSILLLAALLAPIACADEPPPPPAIPSPPAVEVTTEAPEPQLEVRVEEVVGKVQIGQNEAWRNAKSGDLLALDDEIRTEQNGAAVLAIDNEARVRVESGSQVKVRQVSQAVAQLRLERGRIDANISGDRLALRIEASGSKVVAEAKRGSFAIFNSGRGLVAVAAKTGEVKLSAGGTDTILDAGQRAQVDGDGAPTVEAIATTVFLKVAWPEDRLTKAEKTTVRGRVESGTVVHLNGEPIVVDTSGEFEAEVPLREGKNRVELTAADLSGRTIAQAMTVRVRRTAPQVNADTEGLWH